tara:strand:+ start:805 stop:984 length:180 start_codon:yes stop_codon:yes gene_type:complete
MPNVAGKKFPYTPQGMKAAKMAAMGKTPKSMSVETTKKTVGFKKGGCVMTKTNQKPYVG